MPSCGHCCHTISGSFLQLLGSDEEMAVAHPHNWRGCQAEEISAAQVLNTLSVDHQQGLPSMPHDALLRFSGSSSHSSAAMGSAVLLRQEWRVAGGRTQRCY